MIVSCKYDIIDHQYVVNFASIFKKFVFRMTPTGCVFFTLFYLFECFFSKNGIFQMMLWTDPASLSNMLFAEESKQLVPDQTVLGAV